jgi:acyl dehydratase
VTASDQVQLAGPFYDDLVLGQVFDRLPGLTLSEGHAAFHQAVLGDRLRLALDRHLAAEVTGVQEPPAHPGLVCDIAIGQSTLATQRVIANLFYRGLALRRSPRIGDTLRTTTEVVALRDTSVRAGRQPSGLAALRIQTVDQEGRAVLDFHRCAILPMRSHAVRPGHADDLNTISAEFDLASLTDCVAGWDLRAYRAAVPGEHGDAFKPGTEFVIESGDTVTCAPELVRLSLNAAAAHSDPASSGRSRRLVYGGHTIGVALAHVTRALPNLLTVAAWRSCDHLAPVYEGDVLHSTVAVETNRPAAGEGATLIELRVRTHAIRADGDDSGTIPGHRYAGDTQPERVPVLDWRLIGLMA